MIVVGLGNPGKEYEGSRHNVGFMVLNRLAHDLCTPTWKKDRGVSWTKIGEHLLIEPWEYMNRSGSALKNFLQYKKLLSKDSSPALNTQPVFIIHDDVDFPLGEIHEQMNRSAGGHNGVQSIIDTLGTQNFGRLRIGIGNNRDLNIPAEDYVLEKFSVDEAPIISAAIQQAADLLIKKIQA